MRNQKHTIHSQKPKRKECKYNTKKIIKPRKKHKKKKEVIK